MADGNEPPRRASAPAGTQPCRAVPRVHAFGKGGQALRRDPRAPPVMRGWLHKQDSSGLRLWKRRWFVLVDLCLYYYRDSSEQRVRGGLPLPGYEIRILPPAPRPPRFLFTAEHPGMRTYCLGAETPEELNAWVCALRRGAAPLPGPPRSLSLQVPQEPRSVGPPSPLLPERPPGWCSVCPSSEELEGPPLPPPRRPPVPPLPPSKEEAPAREGPCGTERSRGEPRGRAAGAAAAGGRMRRSKTWRPIRHWLFHISLLIGCGQLTPMGPHRSGAPPPRRQPMRRRRGGGRGRVGGAGSAKVWPAAGRGGQSESRSSRPASDGRAGSHAPGGRGRTAEGRGFT
ncbi:uncharacterized protein LOC141750877 isoform X2 [Larus michahellis]|uniref:uncharacterized protein LOC141750877 isoform X2 n=1 Tax=Larus michahellis TaxID=119627 RepID=UPI003D9B06FB